MNPIAINATSRVASTILQRNFKGLIGLPTSVHRKCKRKCTGCGRVLVTNQGSHSVKRNGVRTYCGVYRVLHD